MADSNSYGDLGRRHMLRLLAPPPARPLRTTARLDPDLVRPGHSRAAHALFGWCAACPGKLLDDELVEWRGWARARLHHLRAIELD